MSPRNLNFFYIAYCCCTLHIKKTLLCLVASVDCTHVRHVAPYKIIRTFHILLLSLTAPIQVSYSFLQVLGNIAQEKTTADILVDVQLLPPLDMVTADQDHELHKPKS